MSSQFQLRFLRITEVMYNPPSTAEDDGEQYEFIEVYNAGPVALDLRNTSIKARRFRFEFGESDITTIEPGGYVVVPPSLHISGQRYRWEDEDDADMD